MSVGDIVAELIAKRRRTEIAAAIDEIMGDGEAALRRELLSDAPAGLPSLDEVFRETRTEIEEVAVRAWEPCPESFRNPPGPRSMPEAPKAKVTPLLEKVAGPIFDRLKDTDEEEYIRLGWPWLVASKWRCEFLDRCRAVIKSPTFKEVKREKAYMALWLLIGISGLEDRAKEKFFLGIIKRDGRHIEEPRAKLRR